MNYYEVAPIRIIRSDSDVFTYSYNSKLAIGQIVIIEVGKKQMVGLIIKTVTRPSYATKQIKSIVIEQPLTKQLVKLAIWMSEYYCCPLASVLQSILPNGIQKKRRNKNITQDIAKRTRTNFLFNKDQLSVIKSLELKTDGTFLLQGVTGSGKTEIYINQAKTAINSGHSVIVLVPEISLTSQLVSEFSNHFNNILITHSQMTEAQRHLVWLEAINSKNPRIIIGPRSALFTPFEKIGLIIIDEAHEPSYKQEQAPKYLALRVATILGRLHKSKVIFGSATPNVIDRYLAEVSVKPILFLPNVARHNSKPPQVELIDMRKRENFKKHRFLSDQLLEQINQTLKINKQILIFHNRRGSTSTTLCKSCGWVAECPKCDIPLTLHSDKHQLHCHICGYKNTVFTTCPKCHNADIIHKGIGTKLIESELKKLFPNANIARFDADNSNDETVNSRYGDLYNGAIDIAIGTQVVAKGLDLPNLRTVGVIQADNGLALPDYSSSERTFQLIAQVVGRVGRNEHDTYVIIQSFQPNHPSVAFGITQDYESFYNETIEQRKKNLFPPFSYLLKLTCSFKSETLAIKNTKKLASELLQKLNNEVKILGPTPAFYERLGNSYHWQIILKSPKREYLVQALKFVPRLNWQSDLDPTSLL